MRAIDGPHKGPIENLGNSKMISPLAWARDPCPTLNSLQHKTSKNFRTLRQPKSKPATKDFPDWMSMNREPIPKARQTNSLTSSKRRLEPIPTSVAHNFGASTEAVARSPRWAFSKQTHTAVQIQQPIIPQPSHQSAKQPNGPTGSQRHNPIV